MSMPKGWKSPGQAGTVFEDIPTLYRMPLDTKLTRPMVTPGFLKIYKYPIKKIDIFLKNTGKNLHLQNIRVVKIHPLIH
jgi:hypothetical protein